MNDDLPEKIKLIWDFRGPTAEKIAAHHVVHLKDFIRIEKMKFNIAGVEKLSEMHWSAFMVISKEEMEPLKKALKPHRAQAYE